MSAYVYLLQCADGSLYCGWTSDLARRVAAHRRGTASRYTTTRRPVHIAAAWRADDRSAAMRLEAQIKQLPRAQKVALVAGGRLAGARRVPQKAVASANG